MKDANKRAILDDIYNDIQKWMAKLPINQLPPNVLVEIFRRLAGDDICNVRRVCRLWYKVAIEAADVLPKRRVDWLELSMSSVSAAGRSRLNRIDITNLKTFQELRRSLAAVQSPANRIDPSEIQLVNTRSGAALWFFSDFGRIFEDVRVKGLIFCGSVEFGAKSDVATLLPSLLSLKDHPQFRPSRIEFDEASMKGVTEQQLIDCACSFSKSLQRIELHDSRNFDSLARSVRLIAELCSYLPELLVNYRFFDHTSRITQTAIANAIRKWMNAEPRSCTLLLPSLRTATPVSKYIREIDGVPLEWDLSERKCHIVKLRHPRSGPIPQFFIFS